MTTPKLVGWRAIAQRNRQAAYNASIHGWVDAALWMLNRSYEADFYADSDGEAPYLDMIADSHDQRAIEEADAIELSRSNNLY
jgi:hypothetical protein